MIVVNLNFFIFFYLEKCLFSVSKHKASIYKYVNPWKGCFEMGLEVLGFSAIVR